MCDMTSGTQQRSKIQQQQQQPPSQQQQQQRRAKVVSVACQTDNPFTGCSTATPNAQPCDEDYEYGSYYYVGKDTATVVTDLSSEYDEEDDENRDEVTLRIAISRFSIMSETMCSMVKTIRGVPWRIMVMPKQHVVQKKQQKCMGFFLQCFPYKTYSDAWSCKADAEMRLVAQKPGVSNFVRKTSHTYTAKENDWGYSCFMTWADVLDENQGYIKDDKVLMEIHVKADTPKNLMSRDEFIKAIEQWYNLAEMQMSRGQVDLALEANAQGFKFCKDKNDEMKAKLAAQKEELVKKKVLDSINRIEKHGTTAKTTEPLKPTSLRQALTGAQRTIVSKNGCKGTNKRDRKAAMQQIKKKKAEAAAKEAIQKKKTDCNQSTDSTQSYSPQSPRYSFSSEEEHPRETPESENRATIVTPGGAPIADGDVEKRWLSFTLKSSSNQHPADSSEGEDEEEDEEDVSDYYNEDDMMDEMCEHDSLHGSSSSLEESIGAKVENGCQTEEPFEGVPQPIPRRERRPAGKNQPAAISSNRCQEVTDVRIAQQDSETKLPVKTEDRDRLTQYCQEHFGIDTMEQLFQELINELENNINQTMNSEYNPEGVCTNFFTKLDTLSDDHGTCCLAAGLCTVHARRILDGMREFRRLTESAFKDEFEMMQRYVKEKIMGSEGPKMVTAGSSKGKSEATTRKQAPSDFTLDLSQEGAPPESNDSPASSSSKKKVVAPSSSTQQQQSSSQLRSPPAPGPCCMDPNGHTECEQSISKLLDEMGDCKVYDLIFQKLSAMKDNGANKGLVTLLSQLYQYFQALAANSDQVAKYVDYARYLHTIRATQAMPLKTQVVKESEKRLAESESLIKRLGALHSQEQEQRKKMEDLLKKEEIKCKSETEHVEQLGVQLRDVRNQLKKTEKKAKQEETKNATLLADKMELEDKLKVQKKECETLKKKANEERNKSKKEKERDTEAIRRLEAENLEREAEFQREKSIFEEKIKEARTKENKTEKERKQLQSSLTAIVERARAAEAAQLNLLLDMALTRYEKTKSEIESGINDAEENLKRARTQTDVETMKKSVTEWCTASDDLEKVIRLTRSDYEAAVEAVSKGTKLMSQIDIQSRAAPVLPKVVRLPPVQVVQPSTATTFAPLNIQTPPVGVIGQPRQSSSRCSQVSEPSQQNGYPQSTMATSSSSMNSMKVNHESSQSQLPSLWNWSAPLGNVAEMFRGQSAEPSPRIQPPTMDMWSNDGMTQAAQQAMNRGLYQNHQPINWATAPGWQQRPNSSQQPYNRPY